jgi:pSer/pThr/pTyr-binding forkhead associated (FHA) protein
MHFTVIHKGKRHQFPLVEGVNTIGRGGSSGSRPEVNLILIDEGERVSQKHAQVIVDGNRAILEDCGSLNGTYVKLDDTVFEAHGIPLSHGAIVLIGSTALLFEDE